MYSGYPPPPDQRILFYGEVPFNAIWGSCSLNRHQHRWDFGLRVYPPGALSVSRYYSLGLRAWAFRRAGATGYLPAFGLGVYGEVTPSSPASAACIGEPRTHQRVGFLAQRSFSCLPSRHNRRYRGGNFPFNLQLVFWWRVRAYAAVEYCVCLYIRPRTAIVHRVINC